MGDSSEMQSAHPLKISALKQIIFATQKIKGFQKNAYFLKTLSDAIISNYRTIEEQLGSTFNTAVQNCWPRCILRYLRF